MVNKLLDEDRVLLVDAATAVFGPNWRRPLAEALGVSHSTINGISAGRSMTPAIRCRVGEWAARARIAEREAARHRLALLSRLEEWDFMRE